MSFPVPLKRRVIPLLAIVVVLVGQALYGYFEADDALYLMWPTFALLTSAFWWLAEGNARSSTTVAVIMGLLMFGCNHLGGLMPHGYVAAFWFGLPVATLIAWFVGRRATLAGRPSLPKRCG